MVLEAQVIKVLLVVRQLIMPEAVEEQEVAIMVMEDMQEAPEEAPEVVVVVEILQMRHITEAAGVEPTTFRPRLEEVATKELL